MHLWHENGFGDFCFVSINFPTCQMSRDNSHFQIKMKCIRMDFYLFCISDACLFPQNLWNFGTLYSTNRNPTVFWWNRKKKCWLNLITSDAYGAQNWKNFRSIKVVIWLVGFYRISTRHASCCFNSPPGIHFLESRKLSCLQLWQWVHMRIR